METYGHISAEAWAALTDEATRARIDDESRRGNVPDVARSRVPDADGWERLGDGQRFRDGLQ